MSTPTPQTQLGPDCNQVHLLKGPCILRYNHPGEHQWRYPDRGRGEDYAPAEEETLP